MVDEELIENPFASMYLQPNDAFVPSEAAQFQHSKLFINVFKVLL